MSSFRWEIMYKNILVPLDQSKKAEEVIPTAVAMAGAFNSRITLIYVFEILPLLPQDRESEYRMLKEEGEAYLDRVRPEIEESGISASTVIETGDPSMTICRYAEQEDVDLIIMSASGHGGIERWTLGSVSEKVLRSSPKPVLLVKSASRDLLRGRTILVVDDEPDILEIVSEVLDMCVVHKAQNHDTALEHLRDHRYDLVILDILGVDGFDLLKYTVSRGIPTVMLTAYALTPEALSESARLGAVSFLPKEKIPELESFLADVILNKGRPVWKKLFDRLLPLFRKSFGWTSKEEESAFKELENIVKQ
jgi:nucleotide-binding universal stress UspA family protein/CheY-like chemotaxis protein